MCDNLSLLQVAILLRQLTPNNYVVGGYIRDHLLGLPSKDIDIVTDADYSAMADLFTNAGWHVKETGKHYLVLNISKHGEHYEISNFRMDTDNTGGIIGDINTDSARRDFTVNALYSHLGTSAILDPTGQGLADINTSTLRFIGKPAVRIMEDPLRIWRFYRLLHTKHLIPHPASLRTVRTLYPAAHNLVTPERARSEIERMIGLI